MNILIPDNWLREHLDTKASPQTIQEYLSLCGPSVERIQKTHQQPVYDIEVTTNRVDSMSVRGIAREAATILPEFGIKASLIPLKFVSKPTATTPLDLTIKNNPRLCHRILAVKMSVESVGPSPQWLQDRLTQVGQRPLNNLIDITNYVMWEIGHPIHVFDLDKISTKKIIVREANKGESFTTLDGKTHTTNGGEVVFDDGTGTIIDLPGIMGTANTMVSDSTTTILVWIESVPAPLIRAASMGLAIRTQAAVLNEKHVDPELGKTALRKAIGYYQKIAKGKVESKLVDIYPKPKKIRAARLSHALLTSYLGTDISAKRVTRILKNLGCTATYNPKTTTYKISPPTFRSHDLHISQDYIEEIARIYGYHNLGSTLMATPIPDPTSNLDHQREHFIKKTLVDWGATEIYTYSLVSKELANQSGIPLKDHLQLKNPLTDDLVYLRRSLIPSHLQFLTQNQNHPNMTVFELANIYIPEKSRHLPTERMQLVITTNSSFAHLKGLVDAFVKVMRIPKYRLHPDSTTTSGTIVSGQTVLGTISQVAPLVFATQLDLDSTLSTANPHPTYHPLPTTTPIIEDLTFQLPPHTHIGPVLDTISSQKLVSQVGLKDIYQKNHTFTLHYQHPHKQLTAKNATTIRTHLVNTLAKQYQAKLIGSL